jgi:ribose transport system substrate-binding protein
VQGTSAVIVGVTVWSGWPWGHLRSHSLGRSMAVYTGFSPQFVRVVLLLAVFCLLASNSALGAAQTENPHPGRLAYLVSDVRIPFWGIMARGIKNRALSLGYELAVYSADNQAKRELQFTARLSRETVDGIIVSPTNSSACVTILKIAKKAGIPVVIADIGTDRGEYVSYISSDNKEGSYQIGRVLAKKMLELGWQDGRVGIIAIPQMRENGQARTAGFMRAMNAAGIKGADIHQQVDFSYQETYDFSRKLIDQHADLRAIWLQGSDRYQAALDALRDTGKKDDVLLVSFDAEPVFLELIPKGVLVGAAMQQPYLMGQMAVDALDRHLRGESVERLQQLPILAISSENIDEKLPVIKRNVLGIED